MLPRNSVRSLCLAVLAAGLLLQPFGGLASCCCADTSAGTCCANGDTDTTCRGPSACCGPAADTCRDAGWIGCSCCWQPLPTTTLPTTTQTNFGSLSDLVEIPHFGTPSLFLPAAATNFTPLGNDWLSLPGDHRQQSLLCVWLI